MQFVARMRRNRFLAVWASTLKGESTNDAREYARKLIHEDVRQIGKEHDSVLVKLLTDYLGDLADEATIRAKMVEFLEEAKDQVILEGR